MSSGAANKPKAGAVLFQFSFSPRAHRPRRLPSFSSFCLAARLSQRSPSALARKPIHGAPRIALPEMCGKTPSPSCPVDPAPKDGGGFGPFTTVVASGAWKSARAPSAPHRRPVALVLSASRSRLASSAHSSAADRARETLSAALPGGRQRAGGRESAGRLRRACRRRRDNVHDGGGTRGNHCAAWRGRGGASCLARGKVGCGASRRRLRS